MMRCLSCKYDLRNLTENRCPECGRVFDPNDPRTFDDETAPEPASRVVVRTCFGHLVTFMILFVLLGALALLFQHWFVTN